MASRVRCPRSFPGLGQAALAQVRVLPFGLRQMGEILGGRLGRAGGTAVGWLLGLPVLALAWVASGLSGLGEVACKAMGISPPDPNPS
ncbi:MAG: hypothetical protein L0Z62_37360 [Gemmataceae bacterium]|nr:hypothetical protein [Gemmataceae bacterium]